MKLTPVQFGDQYEGEKLRRLMQEFQRAISQLSAGVAPYVARTPIPSSDGLMYWGGTGFEFVTLGSNLTLTDGVLSAGGGSGGSSTLAGLSDVSLTAPGALSILMYDGTDWVDATVLDSLGLSGPGSDRILFWDESAGGLTWLTVGSGLSITANTITAPGGGGPAAIDDLTDVVITTPSSSQFLRFDGTNWVNSTYTPPLGLGSLSDPNADRILFWDDSAGSLAWLTPGTNLSITGTTINATGGGGGGALDDLTDVVITSPAAGSLLFYNGSSWIDDPVLGIGALTDPGADRILFWDDSGNALAWLTPGTNLSISGTTLNATGGGGGGGYPPVLGHAGL